MKTQKSATNSFAGTQTQSSKAKALVTNTVKSVAKQSTLKKKQKETTEKIETSKEVDAGIHLT